MSEFRNICEMQIRSELIIYIITSYFFTFQCYITTLQLTKVYTYNLILTGYILLVSLRYIRFSWLRHEHIKTAILLIRL